MNEYTFRVLADDQHRRMRAAVARPDHRYVRPPSGRRRRSATP